MDNVISNGNVPENTPNVTAQPFRTRIPKQVRLKINNIDTVLGWYDFISLCTCIHEFESNIFPARATSGNVQVQLL